MRVRRIADEIDDVGLTDRAARSGYDGSGHPAVSLPALLCGPAPQLAAGGGGGIAEGSEQRAGVAHQRRDRQRGRGSAGNFAPLRSGQVTGELEQARPAVVDAGNEYRRTQRGSAHAAQCCRQRMQCIKRERTTVRVQSCDAGDKLRFGSGQCVCGVVISENAENRDRRR